MKITLHTFFILFLSLTLNAQISDNSVETIAFGLGSVAMGYQTEQLQPSPQQWGYNQRQLGRDPLQLGG